MQHFTVACDDHAKDRVERRIPAFAGRVSSNHPIPPLVFALNGVDAGFVHRHDSVDPLAPSERRHTASWHFRFDATSIMTRDHRAIRFEIRAGDQLIERRYLRCDFLRQADPRPILYVMHVPKTAGTSLRMAIEAHAPDLRCLGLYGEGPHISIEQAQTFSRQALDDTDVVFGHYAYGLHRMFDREYKYVSLIRHPAQFLRSYYLFGKYIRKFPGFDAYGSIGEALEQASDGHLDNCFTRYFSGDVFAETMGEEHLAAAIVAIERDFAFVGTSEDMDGAARSISAYLGLPIASLTENVTAATPEDGTIDLDGLGARYHERIALDLRLYAYVRERFGRSSSYHLEPFDRPAEQTKTLKRLFMR